MLPNFLVIGVAKGGTTSLHYYLRQHPEIFLTPVKETNFYWAEGRLQGRKTPRSLDEYARLFASAANRKAVGEISPQYLNSPTAAERIRHDLPDVKLVVSLRNPVDRAYSDYLGRVRILRESRPLEEAVRPGEPILEHGFYFPRLQRYFERFPRAQIHVMLHDDFVQQPAETLRGLLRFLGVDPDHPIDMTMRHNSAAAPRSMIVNRILWPSILIARTLVPRRWRGSGIAEKFLRLTYRRAAPFPPELRENLRARYRDDIIATSKLIGRDLSAWLA